MTGQHKRPTILPACSCSRRLKTAMALVSLLFLAGCEVDLYTNLAEREANSMVATLQRSGIAASRVLQEDSRMKVTVDRGRFADAVGILDAAGLPKQSFASLGEVFEQDGLVASPVQERARMLFALSEELSRTISEIDGVLSARVHVVLPENDPLRRHAAPSSASVFIRHEASLAIAPLVPQIKTLVANGISGLVYDKVTVVPVAAPVPSTAAVAPPAVTFLGLWLLETSVSRAMWIFGGLSLLVVVLLCALVMTLRRQAGRKRYKLETIYR